LICRDASCIDHVPESPISCIWAPQPWVEASVNIA
jgi:hypothetical protein